MSRGERSRDPLDLDVVDHRREDLLPRAVLVADRDPDDLAALVLARLVAEPDRRRLAAALELVDERRREEVERVEAAGPSGASLLIGLAQLKPSLADQRDEPAGPDRASLAARSPSLPRSNSVSMSAAPVAIGTTRRPPAPSCGEQAVAAPRERRRGPRSRRTARGPGARGCRRRRITSTLRDRRARRALGGPLAASSGTRSMLITSRGEPREDGRRVAGAGADLEHVLVARRAASAWQIAATTQGWEMVCSWPIGRAESS